MPTVPVIQTQVADVGGLGGYSAPQAAPVIDQRPQMIQQAGQAMSQSAEQWAQLEAQRRRREDIAASTERSAAIGTQDIEKVAGLQRLQGREAVEAFDGFVADMDKRYKAALESAPEGNQREWLRRHLAQERERLYATAVSHREKQTVVWRAAAATADEEQAQQKAIAMWQSPDAPSLVAEARAKSDELATMNGLDGTAKQQFVASRMSNLHAQTLDVMLTEKRLGQATKYFQENGDEIDPVEKAKIGARLKAEALQETANAIDVNPNFPTFADRMAAVDKLETGDPATALSAEDAKAVRRHLMQAENLRDARMAQEAVEVEREVRQYMAEHPFNDVQDKPELFARAQRYGVRMERNPDTIVEFEKQLEAMPAVADPAKPGQLSMDQLQQMTDGQLLRFLGRGLSDFDRRRWFDFIRGDRDKATRRDKIKAAARVMGLVTEQDVLTNKQQRANDAKALYEFDQHVEAQVKRIREQQKFEVSNNQLQKEVLDPMILDKVTVDTFGSDTVMPVYRAQVEGYLPVDDPNTEDDESLSVSSQDVYAEVNGRLEPLYQVPALERRKIQLDWDKRYPGRQMTVQQMMEAWVEQGRPGAPKQATPAAPAPTINGIPRMADPLGSGGR